MQPDLQANIKTKENPSIVLFDRQQTDQIQVRTLQAYDSLVFVDVGKEDAGSKFEPVLILRHIARGVTKVVGLHLGFEFRHLVQRESERLQGAMVVA